MSSLPNYLLTNRKRVRLSQEEVAFLLGGRGESKGSKISREESYGREPSLRDALAYELLYGKSIRELFAGIREEVEQEMVRRAKLLNLRKVETDSPARQATIANLMARSRLN